MIFINSYRVLRRSAVHMVNDSYLLIFRVIPLCQNFIPDHISLFPDHISRSVEQGIEKFSAYGLDLY